MPIEVHILQNGAGRLWICHGVLRGKDFIANNDRILTTQSYNGVRWVLIDETDATLRDFSQEEIRIIRQRDDRLAAVLPELVAAVLAPKDFSFGMSRMWEMMTERPGWSVRAFRSRPEAWLREEVRRKFGLELPDSLSPP
jgi:hypothetical protein